jgi:hypothetical protein
MKLSLSGGGFFFKPFTQTDSWLGYTVFPNPVANVFGAWAHSITPPLPITSKGRWINIIVYSADMGAGAETFLFQLGAGAPGSEAVLLPTNGNYFRYRYDPALPCLPHSFSFPYLMQAGMNICFRCMSNVAAGDNLYAQVYTWN